MLKLSLSRYLKGTALKITNISIRLESTIYENIYENMGIIIADNTHICIYTRNCFCNIDRQSHRNHYIQSR